MAIKSYKPVTPGRRQLRIVDKSSLHRGKPLKMLVKKMHAKAGRNNLGQITVTGRCGGHKKCYRVIDFKRDRYDIEATVIRHEYDPNRTSFIALIKYDDGIYSYILLPQHVASGDKVVSSRFFIDVKPGNAMSLSNMPVGTVVHNIEEKPSAGGTVARSAGACGRIVGKDNGYASIRLGSKEIKLFPLSCMATIGVLSNPDRKNESLGKAGASIWRGRRPDVRGIAKNSCDHPMGGGEAKGKGNRHPVSATGVCAKGGRTRKKKKSSNRLIVMKRHNK